MSAHPDGATIRFRVVPRAPSTAITGRHGASAKLRVHAPPVGGAANDEVCRFVADRCGVRPRDVQILMGDRSRDKVVLVRGVTVSDVRAGLREG
ncbi:MAG: DUF167 domain-containing protein [Nitriliruptoraceae bacterium]